ncbi:MAG: DegV family protein [Lachnospiraceae bacterium]|nr:DegV family protein [Lachnospiraceae bacterium]
MSIILMTDSAADYTAKEREEKNIIIVPLTVFVNDESFLDGYTIDAEGFYEKLSHGDCYPRTSQPSPELFLEHFNRAKENGDSVICINISSALSGTYQSAMIAKDMAEYDNIYVLDSLLVAPAQRILVDHAKELIDSGMDFKAIVEELEEYKKRVRIFAIVDTLEYLKKGGRLSAAEAAIGELVNIKPMITITEEGKLVSFGKALGKARAFKSLIKKFESAPADENFPLIFLHSSDEKGCLEFKNKFISAHPEQNIADFLVNLGPTVGSHTGPGVISIAYVMKKA